MIKKLICSTTITICFLIVILQLHLHPPIAADARSLVDITATGPQFLSPPWTSKKLGMELHGAPPPPPSKDADVWNSNTIKVKVVNKAGVDGSSSRREGSGDAGPKIGVAN